MQSQGFTCTVKAEHAQSEGVHAHSRVYMHSQRYTYVHAQLGDMHSQGRTCTVKGVTCTATGDSCTVGGGGGKNLTVTDLKSQKQG